MSYAVAQLGSLMKKRITVSHPSPELCTYPTVKEELNKYLNEWGDEYIPSLTPAL